MSTFNASLSNKKKLWGWGAALAIFLSAFLAFLELAGDVYEKEPFPWDASIMLFIHHLASPTLDSLMKMITQTGGALGVLVFLLLVYFLWRQQRVGLAIAAIINYVGAVTLNILLKNFFARPRPAIFAPLTSEQSYSFPSGHTIAAIALYGFIALILWQSTHRKSAILTGCWVLLIGLSRIYLGVHYPSDVLGALLIGSVWIGFVMVWYQFSNGFQFLQRKLH